MRPPSWTTDETERASAMWARGEKAKTIGLAIGRTRNSVIGQMNRLKRPKLRREPKSKPRVEAVLRAPRFVAPRAVAPAKIAETTKPRVPPPDGVTMLELADRGMCRWMLSSARYCGQKTLEIRGSYCEKHSGSIYQKDSRARRPTGWTW